MKFESRTYQHLRIVVVLRFIMASILPLKHVLLTPNLPVLVQIRVEHHCAHELLHKGLVLGICVLDHGLRQILNLMHADRLSFLREATALNHKLVYIFRNYAADLHRFSSNVGGRQVNPVLVCDPSCLH